MTKVINLCSPFVLLVASAACASDAPRCITEKMLESLRSDLSSYQVRKIDTLDQSSEGGEVTFFHADATLAAIRAVYFGETGKTEIEYRFESPQIYAVALIDTYYTAPIYVEGSEVAGISESRFVVCEGELVRGIGDDFVQAYERAKEALESALKRQREVPQA